jgi:hypothetical protein
MNFLIHESNLPMRNLDSGEFKIIFNELLKIIFYKFFHKHTNRATHVTSYKIRTKHKLFHN